MPGLFLFHVRLHAAMPPVTRTLLLCLVAFLSALPVPAGAQDDAWAQAQARALWDRDEWKRLVHYRPARWPGRWESQADDPRFFLAPDGDRDPAAELEATLAAFREPADKGNEHAQCRFVARLAWLREQLDLGALPQPDCSDYREFRGLVQATHAVLVFPSYYLNSPSSMFGHTLLRLDRAEADGGSEYLSFAVNFGALVNPDDNGLFYAFRGLTGGYRGQFEVDQYFKKIQEYNRDENRDIWEYPLDLRPDEIERLVQHLWELRRINFAYYFFDENCSYRILELLEVARPGIDLTGGFGLTAIPVDTVRAVERAGLVRGKRFRPAQGTVLRQRLDTLPPSLHALVREVSASADRLEAPDVQALDPASRAALIDAAYKYLRYTQTGEARDERVAQRSFRLLQALQQHAGDLPPAAPPPDPATSPDLSHGSRRLSVGAWNQEGLDYLTVGLRMALHNQEENRAGFPAGAQINIGNLDLRLEQDGEVDIERLDFVDILSLSPRDRFFKPLSWSVDTGIERQWAGGREHRVAQVNGGVGATVTIRDDNRLYGMTTARLEHNHGFEDPLQAAAGLRAGVLMDRGPFLFHWDAGVEQFGNGQTRGRVQLRNNLRLSRNQALHLELLWRDVRPDDTLAIGLRYQYYY
jgi:hypothetical protein